MKKNLLPYIIIIVIIIIIITITLLILKNHLIVENKEVGHIDFSQLDEVTDRNDYYMVKTILNKYYYAINYLDADIKDLDVEYSDSKSEQEEIVKEYTQEGIEILQDILDKECIETLSLNEENILENFKQYKNSEYTITKMYYAQKNINTDLYFIKGMLDYEKEFELIVKTDSYTGTFSIYSDQYIKQKGYNEECIETEFNIETIEYIDVNDNNEYVKNDITDKIMAQYYLYDYGNLVSNNPEKAYEKLDEEYKENRFPTLEKFKNYIESSGKTYNLLKLNEYSVEKYDDYTLFTCKDQYGDIYIFKDKNIMEYTVQLDDYTFYSEKFKQKYNSASTEEKVKLNIELLITMINMKDYNSIYNMLDSDFKSTNFATLEKFESYVEETFFDYNVLGSISIVEQGKNYAITVNYKDGYSSVAEKKVMNIVMKLQEETSFIFSFEI